MPARRLYAGADPLRAPLPHLTVVNAAWLLPWEYGPRAEDVASWLTASAAATIGEAYASTLREVREEAAKVRAAVPVLGGEEAPTFPPPPRMNAGPENGGGKLPPPCEAEPTPASPPRSAETGKAKALAWRLTSPPTPTRRAASAGNGGGGHWTMVVARDVALSNNPLGAEKGGSGWQRGRPDVHGPRPLAVGLPGAPPPGTNAFATPFRPSAFAAGGPFARQPKAAAWLRSSPPAHHHGEGTGRGPY